MSLMNYFRTEPDVIQIDSVAAKMATQFFIEKAWIRSMKVSPYMMFLKN